MSGDAGRMRIGEVHALLRQEYPDIELSKIRYYEDKGLVLPSRSRKGYRLYAERDVACLREAIRLAQEEFVPLRVVRVRLVEQGLLSDVGATSSTRHVARDASRAVSAPVPSTSEAPARAALTVVATNGSSSASPEATADVDLDQLFGMQDFFHVCGLEASALNQLIGLGLVTPTTSSGETVYSGWDLRVAQTAGPLMARGVDVRFLGSLRRVVEREMGVLEDLTEPLRAPGSRLDSEQTRRVVAMVAEEMEALRRLLLERSVQTYVGR